MDPLKALQDKAKKLRYDPPKGVGQIDFSKMVTGYVGSRQPTLNPSATKRDVSTDESKLQGSFTEKKTPSAQKMDYKQTTGEISGKRVVDESLKQSSTQKYSTNHVFATKQDVYDINDGNKITAKAGKLDIRGSTANDHNIIVDSNTKTRFGASQAGSFSRSPNLIVQEKIDFEGSKNPNPKKPLLDDGNNSNLYDLTQHEFDEIYNAISPDGKKELEFAAGFITKKSLERDRDASHERNKTPPPSSKKVVSFVSAPINGKNTVLRGSIISDSLQPPDNLQPVLRNPFLGSNLPVAAFTPSNTDRAASESSALNTNSEILLNKAVEKLQAQFKAPKKPNDLDADRMLANLFSNIQRIEGFTASILTSSTGLNLGAFAQHNIFSVQKSMEAAFLKVQIESNELKVPLNADALNNGVLITFKA